MLLTQLPFRGQGQTSAIKFSFCVDSIEFERAALVDFPLLVSATSLETFYRHISQSNYQPIINSLLRYKEVHKTDDWLYYQLVRKAAQQISPKNENYYRYTLYKWFILAKSGYDVLLSTAGNLLLFYVQSDENVYNVPVRIKNGKQYVCLNYHDYKNIDLENVNLSEVPLFVPEASKGFSYKVTQIPDISSSEYVEKNIRFRFYEMNYNFKVRLNPQVPVLFRNYPVVDYDSYFNIPLSKETYASLIPVLRKNVRGLNEKNGIDYLMRFVRTAFEFQPDLPAFGGEKRLTAEQTLFYDQSDCEDRVGLFFYLVKEIYDLPVIVLSYPDHLTAAVQFKKPFGHTILHNGRLYSVCEPTPQQQDLAIGGILPGLAKIPFQVVYAYTPAAKKGDR
jgi:hypothetical protein